MTAKMFNGNDSIDQNWSPKNLSDSGRDQFTTEHVTNKILNTIRMEFKKLQSFHVKNIYLL
jgi:hypothetical protein